MTSMLLPSTLVVDITAMDMISSTPRAHIQKVNFPSHLHRETVTHHETTKLYDHLCVAGLRQVPRHSGPTENPNIF